MKRSHYPMKTFGEVASHLKGANTFSILDAKSCFWQLKLDEESSLLCTFNDSNWLLQVHKCAPKIFQRTMDHMVEDLDGVEVIKDDIIITGDKPTHDGRLMEFLERASKKSFKLQCKQREMQNLPEGSALGRTSTHCRGPED